MSKSREVTMTRKRLWLWLAAAYYLGRWDAWVGRKLREKRVESPRDLHTILQDIHVHSPSRTPDGRKVNGLQG